MTTSSIVSRCCMVLDLVTGAGPLDFTDIVRQAGLPKSSIHRLLAILTNEGLVEFDPSRQIYLPGRRLTGWAAGTFSGNRLPELSHDALRRLGENTGANVALSVLRADAVLYMSTLQTGAPYRHAPGVGGQSPLHASAAGKVFLAHLEQGRLKSILATLPLDRFNERTIVDTETLRLDLQQVRANGYAACDREEFLQVAGLAAPVFDNTGQVVAAVSLWNTVDHQSMSDLLEFAPTLKEQARLISERLGWGAVPIRPSPAVS
ncbi:MAG: IclR family transcriptional regulator [Pseudomonadota bacterium]